MVMVSVLEVVMGTYPVLILSEFGKPAASKTLASRRLQVVRWVYERR